MDVNRLLSFYVEHLQTIIPVLIVLVLGLIFGALLLTVWRKDEPKTAEDLSAIEETLKKVLEATRHQPAQSVVGDSAVTSNAGDEKATTGAGATAAGAPSVDTSALNAAIADRERMIGELKAKISELEAQKAAASSGAAGSAADPGLADRIKDLEARLKEYEIIEDDIANLSLYKEENARLKDELAKLKSSGGGVSIETPAAEQLAEEMGLKAPEDQGESLEEALKKLGEEPVIEPTPAPSMAIQAESAAPDTPAAAEPDLVDQLQSMMGEKSASQLSGDESSSAAPAEPAAPAESAASAANPAEAEVPEVLQGFDPDKIAEEAGALLADAETGPPEPEDDTGMKLIEEFEKFSSDTETKT